MVDHAYVITWSGSCYNMECFAFVIEGAILML